MDQASSDQRARRHPRPTQFDYLYLRELGGALREAVTGIPGPVHDVLDVFCGSKPYADLFPPGARYVGLDIVDAYGVADVVSDEFLPFDDASFDVIVSTEAFYYVEDSDRGVAEIRRVLRPGGTVILTVPLVYEYERAGFEHRFTPHELRRLFAGWDELTVRELGGRAVTWTAMTGRLADLVRRRLEWRGTGRLFAALNVALNLVGTGLGRAERRLASGRTALPMGLLVSARRPVDDA